MEYINDFSLKGLGSNYSNKIEGSNSMEYTNDFSLKGVWKISGIVRNLDQ